MSSLAAPGRVGQQTRGGARDVGGGHRRERRVGVGSEHEHPLVPDQLDLVQQVLHEERRLQRAVRGAAGFEHLVHRPGRRQQPGRTGEAAAERGDGDDAGVRRARGPRPRSVARSRGSARSRRERGSSGARARTLRRRRSARSRARRGRRASRRRRRRARAAPSGSRVGSRAISRSGAPAARRDVGDGGTDRAGGSGDDDHGSIVTGSRRGREGPVRPRSLPSRA